MTDAAAYPTLAPPAAPAAAASVQRWVACIAALETVYAPPAAARGEALAPHTPAEWRAVAALADLRLWVALPTNSSGLRIQLQYQRACQAGALTPNP